MCTSEAACPAGRSRSNCVTTHSAVGTQHASVHELPRFVLNETTPLGVILRVLRMTAYAI